jgi:hypothetical protein
MPEQGVTFIAMFSRISSAPAMRDRATARIAACTIALFLGANLPALAQEFQPVPAPAAGRSAQPSKSISGPELLAALRKGGYVIYFRHTSTDMSRDDSGSRSDEDCDKQRPLTEQGREEARRIGAAFKELRIPVGTVLASARCRTMETAMLAFGRAEKSSEVRGGPLRDPSPERYAGLRRLLSTPPPPGANLVISSHGNPFYATAGAPYLAEGEAAVVRPSGKDFEIFARIRHEGWRHLNDTTPATGE